MLQRFLQLTVILLVALGAVVLLIRLYYGLTTTATPPVTRFSAEACNRPCWLGIEPGRTAVPDAITILQENDIAYSVARRRSVVFELASFSGDFWSLNPGVGVVQGLNLRAQPCPLNILLHYGKPDLIVGHPTGLILYFEEGISVNLSELADNDKTYNIDVSFLTQETMRRYIDDSRSLGTSAQSVRTLRWKQAEADIRRVCR